ncbi:class I SAM-dependent DNA methyltransferase [Pseudalkalibacillus sp. Hm43]|uniref:class I SAM-dependent DNA methyltransferase n=1 Tax=Pseudalkalibacillus sp. Hm43 TaxID=3450742 RepID=UPI003F43BAD5
MRKKADTIQLFDLWAESYDQYIQNPNGPLLGYETSLEEASYWLKEKRFKTILDIGIGTGGFIKRFHADEYHGIDLSEKMLEECKQNHPDYTLSQGTFNETNQAFEAFELVVSSFTFHEVIPEDRLSACQETFRILQKDGYFLLVDIMFPSESARNQAKETIAQYWDDSEDYPLVMNMDKHLREAGFKSIQWKQTGPYHWAVIAKK